jgi:C_GCAxxG_C_C family probable redox protein
MENKTIRKKVYGHFESGFHCSEAVAKTVLGAFSTQPHAGVIKSASGFGGGVAGSTEELCGAFTGGVIALSFLLGRETPGEDMQRCGDVIKTFKERFLEKFGSVHCGTILEGFGEEGAMGCVTLTAETAVIITGLLHDMEMESRMKVTELDLQPKEKVSLGVCPFSHTAH